MFEIDNEIVLVTGASRGIGRSIALALGSRGALVIGTATTQDGAQNITATFRDRGIRGKGEILEVTKPESVMVLVGKIEKEFSPVSILVNNAGITRDNLLIKMTNEEWNDVLDTNLFSMFRVSKACLRGMIRARKGRIINLASVVATTGNPGQTNYSAAKAGVIGFTKSLAQEVASRGITVNAIAPGFIDTEMTAGLQEARRNDLISKIPLGRLGSVEDIAATAVFLASGEAGYITGQVIHSNGGMYMST
jgi:3-oxoacyl-[acyl-carrier protein] reductase